MAERSGADSASSGQPGERRSFSVARSILTVSASNLALPLSALATGPILARVLHPTGRGELAAILAPLSLFLFVGHLGVPEAVTYVVARRIAPRATALKLGAVLGAAAGLLTAAVLAGLAPVLLADYPDGLPVLLALGATAPLVMVGWALRGAARGEGRFDLLNFERWFSVLSRLALILLLTVVGGLTVTSAAVATHGTLLLAILTLVPIALHAGPAGNARRLAPSVIRYSLRSWAGSVSSLLVLRLDQAVLVPLAGARQLGYYAVAVSIAEVPVVALDAVRDVIFAAAADRDDPGLVARATRMVVAVAIPAIAIGLLVIPLALPVLFGHGFAPAVRMSQILLIGSLPSAVAIVVGAGLSSLGRPGLGAIAQGSAAAFTVIGLFVLVPPLGAIGAAYTSLGAYLLAASVSLAAMVRVAGLSAGQFLLPRRADFAELVARVANRLRGPGDGGSSARS